MPIGSSTRVKFWCASSIPISRKISEFTTKAAYSQNDSTASRPLGEMAPRGPRLPSMMPAVRVASTPDTSSCSASRNEP